jgi:hypothetical protein
VIESSEMHQRSQPNLAALLILGVAVISVLLGNGCRNRVRPGEDDSKAKLRGEPDQYSATIVRTIEDGSGRTPIITREARSGEQRREEWTEQDHNRAVIWRPDLGKGYLLDLDLQAFVEIAMAGENLYNDSHLQDRVSADSSIGLVEAVDRAVDDAPSPDGVETRELAPAQIGDHLCNVYELRATFTDGHTEITRTFRASNLGGLALRIESESQPASVRVITERRDVSLSLAPDTFTVPANFKKVDKLER